MGYKKYLIRVTEFKRYVGGNTALHRLCHLLNEKGLTAYVTGMPNPDWNEKYADAAKIRELILEDAIAVYPEVYPGNPLNARYVVRYVLNNPRKRIDYEHEIIIAWLPSLAKRLKRCDGILWFSLIEPEIFNNDSGYTRSGSVCYVGKGKLSPRIKETESSLRITRTWPARREELALLFKKSELFYSYDNFTGLTWEARLCGCPVVIIPSPDYSKEEVLAENNEVGLSYGLGDIERAKRTVREYGDVYKKLSDNYFKLDDFVRVTQDSCRSGRGYPEIDLTMEYLYRHYSGIEVLAGKTASDKEKYFLRNFHRVFLDKKRIYLLLKIMLCKLRLRGLIVGMKKAIG